MKDSSFILSVSQFLDAVNLALESAADYEIQGEVTDFKKGKWISFTLKDPEDAALLKCVMGEWTWRRVGIELEDGMQVKISGHAKVNKKYGSFGMWVETVEPLGEGSLKKAYELLLKRLQEEGIFERKRAIPECINRIGVVSSRYGVVIQDFTKNLSRLGYSLQFVDTRVEGEGAVAGIIHGIRTLNQSKRQLDVIVIIRGGGSLESMQAFNNEAVVRAIFGSRLPVIAGIGHDVDVPLACLVADASASTPTGTALLINRSWSILVETLPRTEQYLLHQYEGVLRRAAHSLELSTHQIMYSLGRIFTAFRQKESALKRGLQRLGEQLALATKKVSESSMGMQQVFGRVLAQQQERLLQWQQYLQAVSPERNLRLGYSIVRNQLGKVVKSVTDVTLEDSMTTRVADGTIQSTITAIS